jgi:hypothetical protein
MRSPWKVLALTAIAAALLASGAQAVDAARVFTAGAPPALRHSLDLWATIDVCNPADQPDTVGVRGSMPGDRVATDAIYMRFRLQYEGASGTWVDFTGGLKPGFVKVASAKKAHQDGWSFQVKPPRSPRTTTLRGVVTFQWRRAATVLASISRPTTAGHESLRGADPRDFSAATCTIP